MNFSAAPQKGVSRSDFDAPQSFSAHSGKLPKVVASVVFALTMLRLVFAGLTELLPEEAYYWTYSKHPAWSYFDHPPMVAWVIRAGTTFFGDTEFGVRFGTIMLSAASCALMFLTGRLWFGERDALRATLLYALLPIFVGAGFIVTPDQPLLFFWLLALYGFSKGLHTGRWRDWLLGGAAFGGALLSKYYAVLLGPSLLLFLALSHAHRRWLLRPQPWVAFALALLVFSPVIFWNANHEWASFLFHLKRTAGSHSHSDSLRNFSGFWAVQAGILTPLVFALFAFSVWQGIERIWREHDERWNFALSFSLPLFFFFAAASLKVEVHVNWTAPAFLSLLPGAAHTFDTVMQTGSAVRRAKWWGIGARVSLAVCTVAIIVGLTSLTWDIPPLYEQAGGWRRVAAAVEATETALEKKSGQDPFVLDTGKYDLAAEVGFYSREPKEQVNNYALGKRGLGFRYWTDLDDFEGAPAVALLERPDRGTLRRLEERFDRIESPEQLDVRGPGRHQRTIYLVECYGYRGAGGP